MIFQRIKIIKSFYINKQAKKMFISMYPKSFAYVSFYYYFSINARRNLAYILLCCLGPSKFFRQCSCEQKAVTVFDLISARGA